MKLEKICISSLTLFFLVSVFLVSCKKATEANEDNKKVNNDQNTAVNNAGNNPSQKPELPKGTEIMAESQQLLETGDYGTDSGRAQPAFYLQTIYREHSGQAWQVDTYESKFLITYERGRTKYYGPYNDSQISLLHEMLIKFIEWDDLAISNRPSSFVKQIPLDSTALWHNEGFNSIPQENAILEYEWENTASDDGEVKQLSTLRFNLTSRDHAWGNLLTSQEVRSFKIILEQMINCRKKFTALNNQKMKELASKSAERESQQKDFK